MVKVCDAIMGSGKTSAAISYINAHPEKRFLYITPYLPEAARIKEGCPDAHFVEPSQKYSEFEFSKSIHSLYLIGEGQNIASTHQALMYYTDETIQKLKENNYAIIIDEEINILQKERKISFDDVRVAEKAGLIQETRPGEYELTGMEYGYGRYSHMLRIMKSRPLIYTKGKKFPDIHYWMYPPNIFKELNEVIVMTYLFDQSEMQQYFEMYDIKYEYIGIRRTEDGGYEFAEDGDYVPEYVSHLKDMINIDERGKINDIGEPWRALSMNWYKTHEEDGMDELRRNLHNYFNKRNAGIPSCERMCGTYKSYWGKIRGKGYWNSDVLFCQKSSNEYRNRTVLAYPVNIFPDTNLSKIYKSYGVEFDMNRYALSIMIQWIWRSAIREGKPISIYVPSRRMRGLLKDWLDSLSIGNIKNLKLEESA